MKKRKNIITVAIDSPAAAGAGTQAKLIAKHYNLQHLDTGRIYRLIGKLKLKDDKNFTYYLIKKKIKNLKIGDVSEPIILSNGILILQIKDTKITEIKNDMNAELKKAINYERNRQLNQFSKIYYNKIKKNLEFDE